MVISAALFTNDMFDVVKADILGSHISFELALRT